MSAAKGDRVRKLMHHYPLANRSEMRELRLLIGAHDNLHIVGNEDGWAPSLPPNI